MAMEINGRYDHYRSGYAERAETKQVSEKAKKAEMAERTEKAKMSERADAPKDAYIGSGESGAKPSGLYRLGRDENGNRKVYYDDPKKAGDPGRRERAEGKADGSGKPAEKCTVNTDKVEQEIRKLQEKRRQLEQQIRASSGEEEKVRELENKLAQVESELSRKDNDAYRRQNAVVSG